MDGQPPRRPSNFCPGTSSSSITHDNFVTPVRPKRYPFNKEERSERKARYDRIEQLTQELSAAVRDEMTRRKDLWDVDGAREEEAFWEARKQEVYKGLELLADEIHRAIRDRKKEAVLDLWSKEIEERRINAARQAAPREDG
ncbi:hypothetical protein EX30DRAFT_246425 [Ascodesmis nigricans]|uniref:Uncharacterized protein n=1 Tax=Ascodesmis nigricans TaxID=341454 RepID=A0A4V3SHJ9_9PEZI|nr:hypothetical protein EX30DRAFT_246425 [Ascodesmis nigricans]